MSTRGRVHYSIYSYAVTMKFLTVMLLTVLASALAVKVHYEQNDADQLFGKFIQDHKRVYKDEQDKQVHFEAFKKSLDLINRLNDNSPHATYGINKFADYTDEEKKAMAGFKPKKQ